MTSAVTKEARFHAIVSTVEAARAAVRGGAGVIQLRNKELSDRAFLEAARAALCATRQANRLLIINDRVHIAAAAGADGHGGAASLRR